MNYKDSTARGSAKTLAAKHNHRNDITNFWLVADISHCLDPDLLAMMDTYYSDDHFKPLSSTQRYYSVIDAYENNSITELQAKHIISEYCQGFVWENSK